MQIKQIDNSVLDAINAGDEKAFASLYMAYYTYLCSICFYWLGDREAAREVVNDVFMQVWNRRGSLTYPIHAYLLRSTQNRAIDYLRARQSRHRTLKGHKEQYDLSFQERYIRSTPEPLQYVELRSTEDEIKKALERLPPRCREIFEAWFNEGRSAEDISESMGIKVSTVRVQLKTAFDRLREMLKHLL